VKLALEDAVLFDEVLEDALLSATETARQDDSEDVKERGHGAGERSRWEGDGGISAIFVAAEAARDRSGDSAMQ
jgi:hypothetical protein